VGDYLWRESGKLAQKERPEGFDGVKWWDVWGMKRVEHELEVSREVFVEMRRPLARKRDKVTGAKVRRPSGLDGLAVTNVDGLTLATGLVAWAEREVADDVQQRSQGGVQGAKPPGDGGSVNDKTTERARRREALRAARRAAKRQGSEEAAQDAWIAEQLGEWGYRWESAAASEPQAPEPPPSTD
jgi:hypothetical protein